MKGYSANLSVPTRGGHLMSRVTLLALQVLVAIVAYSMLAAESATGGARCSAASGCRRSSSRQPESDVFSQIVGWFFDRRDLEAPDDHVVESIWLWLQQLGLPSPFLVAKGDGASCILREKGLDLLQLPFSAH